MHVELILEEPVVDEDPEGSGDYVTEPFRRTTWLIWSKGQIVAVSGRAYRHRKDAIKALEAVTGGLVQYKTVRGRRHPRGLHRGLGHWIRIERVQ